MLWTDLAFVITFCLSTFLLFWACHIRQWPLRALLISQFMVSVIYIPSTLPLSFVIWLAMKIRLDHNLGSRSYFDDFAVKQFSKAALIFALTYGVIKNPQEIINVQSLWSLTFASLGLMELDKNRRQLWAYLLLLFVASLVGVLWGGAQLAPVDNPFGAWLVIDRAWIDWLIGIDLGLILAALIQILPVINWLNHLTKFLKILMSVTMVLLPRQAKGRIIGLSFGVALTLIIPYFLLGNKNTGTLENSLILLVGWVFCSWVFHSYTLAAIAQRGSRIETGFLVLGLAIFLITAFYISFMLPIAASMFVVILLLLFLTTYFFALIARRNVSHPL